MEGNWDNGCVISENPHWMSFPFDHRGRDRFLSALQVLTLDGYESDALGGPRSRRWYWPDWVHRDRDRTKTSGLQSNKTSFERWIEAMDFSKLHTVHFVREGTFRMGNSYSLTDNVVKVLPPRLRGIRKLGLYDRIGERFILGLPKNSLQYLAWRHPWNPYPQFPWDGSWRSQSSLNSPLIPVLQHQGVSLRHLYFHTDETLQYVAPGLSVLEIQKMVELAPNLNSLVIDLQRNNETRDWPWEELKLIAGGLSELVDLTVYVDLVNQPYCHDNYYNPISHCKQLKLAIDCIDACITKPTVDKVSVTEIAHFLRKHKAGKSLHRFTLRAGDWGPDRDYGMNGPLWFDGTRAQARCNFVNTAVVHVDTFGPIQCEAWSTDIYNWREDYFTPSPKRMFEFQDRYLDFFRS